MLILNEIKNNKKKKKYKNSHTDNRAITLPSRTRLPADACIYKSLKYTL